MATAAEQQQIIELVVGLVGAAPGADILTELEALFDAGLTLEAMADAVVANAAFETIYASTLSNADFTTAFLANLLGSEVSAENLALAQDAVVGLLNGGQSRGSVMLAATQAVIAVDPADADFGAAATALTNQVAAATYYSVTVGVSSESLDTLTAVVSTVTSDAATLTAANAATDAANITFSFASDATNDQILEGQPATYTVTASGPVAEDTDVVFTVAASNVDAADQGTSDTNLDDFANGTFNPVTVTILAGETEASFSVTGANDSITELPEGYSLTAVVQGQTFTANTTLLDGAGIISLTTGIDDVEGSLFADIITGTLDQSGGNDSGTFSLLDTIDGSDGVDTFNLNILDAAHVAPVSATVSNVEIVNVKSVAALTLDTTAWAGLTNYNVTGAVGAVDIDAGAAVDVSVMNAQAAVDVDNAKDVTVTAKGAGAITVDQAAGVTVNVSESAAANAVVLGGATANTGAIAVNATGAKYVAGTTATLAAITATGGTEMSAWQSASSDSAAAATDGAAGTITQGAVGLTGGSTTTSMTVTQDQAVAAKNAVPAVAAVKGTKTVTFTAMAAADITTVDGLVFTATKALTAEEVATAFSNLTASDLQSAGGPTANGIFTVTSAANYTTGAASGAVVTYTETVAGTANAFTAVNSGAAANPTIAVVLTGNAATKGVTGVLGVVAGAVTLADGGTSSLTTVTVDGYGNSTLASNALTDLSLANSGTGTFGVSTTSATLNLTVNDVDAAVTLDAGGANVTTLNLMTAGTKSAATSALTAAGVTALNISGTTDIDLTSATLTALQTVIVSGAAGATFDVDEADTITSITTTAGTGKVTSFIDPTKGTYTGGAGVDNLTTSAVAPTKAIALGAGDDTATLATGTSAIGAGGSINGEAGTDTLSMVAADAVTASGSALFAGSVTGFERLMLTGAIGVQAVDVAALGSYNYVTVAGSTDDAGNADESITISKLASGGTVAINATIGLAADDDGVIVAVTDALTGAADVLNVVVSGAAAVDAGTVAAANVETINVTSTNAGITPGIAHLLEISDAAVTTMTAAGTGGLNLTLNANVVALTSLDGSAMTGVLTASTNGTVAQTIIGGSAGDTLTATGTSDVLNGGAGADTLIAGNLTQLTGGDGADTFNMTATTTNVNSYASILDASSGDIIKANAGAFVSGAVTLAPTAVFQDFANAAVNSSTTNADVLWFQFGGNTYVIQDATTGGAAYDDTADTIIQLTGLVDLSTASFNATQGTIEIA